MKKDERRAPILRFKGFSDDWEQRKLGEMSLSFDYGLNVASKEFDGKNKYIRITDIDDNSRKFNQKNITSPDVNLSSAEKYKLVEGDILFARTGATVGKTYIYIPSDGLVYYAGFLIRARIKPEYNPEFIFQNTLTKRYMNFIKFTSMRSGQPGINSKEYAQYQIMVPRRIEQNKISNYLRSLDALITLHQRKLEMLKELQQLYLLNIFPINNEKRPKIRFKHFDNFWAPRKLKSIFKEFTKKSVIEDEYTTLSSTNTGIEVRTGRVSGKSNKGYKIIEVGDLVLSPQNLWLGNININSLITGLVSPSYKTFKIIDVNPAFIEPQLKNKKMIYEYNQASIQGASIVRKNLNIDAFNEIVIQIPSQNEQYQIANFLLNLNKIISSLDKKVKILNDIKKQYLDLLFI